MSRKSLLLSFCFLSAISILQAGKLRPEGIRVLPRIQKQESSRASRNKEDARMSLPVLGFPPRGDSSPLGSVIKALPPLSLSFYG